MPPALIEYITTYGYPTVFSLVLLQELGIPNPVPNELILIFSGYLAFVGRLEIGTLLLTVIAADCIGTLGLYTIFYYFGPAILKRAPSWLAISRIEVLKGRLHGGGGWRIYVARLIPYVRGYTSIAAGLLRLSPKIFVPAVVVSALIWSGGYVLLGMFAGPRWESIAERFGPRTSLSILAVLLLLIFLGPIVYDKIKRRSKPQLL